MKKFILLFTIIFNVSFINSINAAELLLENFENSTSGTINGATYTSNGYQGYGMLFDEPGDYVKFNSSKFPSEGTFEAYIYITGDNSAWSRDIIFDTNARAGYSGAHIALYLTEERKLVFREWGSTIPEIYNVYGTTELSLNTWYAVGVSWGAQGVHIYVNGELDASDTSLTYNWDADESVYLGDCPDDDWAGSNYYNSFYGILDSVRTSDLEQDITYSIVEDEADSVDCDIDISALSISGSQTVGSPVTFTVEANNSCGNIKQFRFSMHPDYGTNGYDELHWASMTSSEYQTGNSCTYTFDEAGKYVVVAWVKHDASDSNTGVEIIGKTVSINETNETTAVNIKNIAVSGFCRTGAPVTFTVDADNSNDAPVYYRFSVHPDYGTSDYDGTQWQQMTSSEYQTDNYCTHTFNEPGKYIVVAWAKNSPGDPNEGVEMIGLSVNIESSSGTIGDTVIDAETSAEEIAGISANDDGTVSLTTSANGSLGENFEVDSLIILPPGEDERFPFGVSGNVSSVTTNSDGSVTATLEEATLSDVVDELYQETTTGLNASNFIGAISPPATQATQSQQARLSPLSMANPNAIKYAIDGGVIVKNSTTSDRSAAAYVTELGDVELNLTVKLQDMGIDVAGIQADAAFVISGSLNNLALTHLIDFDAGSGLNELDLKITGDINIESKLEGNGSITLGYYDAAWKDVEDSQLSLLGMTAKLTGLNRKDKIGKFPLVGLVWSTPCPNTCITSIGSTRTPINLASLGGVIVWVYLDASGSITFEGEFGSRVHADFSLGVKQPINGDLEVHYSMTNDGDDRLIEMPFISGSVSFNARTGISLDVDAFALGVRLANASAQAAANFNTDIEGDLSFGTDALGEEWSWDGSACITTCYGAGLILSANVNIGVDLDLFTSELWNVDAGIGYSYSGQWPSEEEIETPGWHGLGDLTWYTADVLYVCFGEADEESIVGTYTGTYTGGRGGYFQIQFFNDGTMELSTLTGGGNGTYTISGNSISASGTDPSNGETVTINATLSGTSLSGTWCSDFGHSGTFEAEKLADERRLSGIIYHEGDPIEGIKIYLEEAPDYYDYSSSDGSICISGFPVGTYTIVIEYGQENYRYYDISWGSETTEHYFSFNI